MAGEKGQADGGPDWAQIQEEIRCPLCEYNLRGLAEPRCPECGYRFTWLEMLDPSQRLHPYLFEHHPRRDISSFFRTALGQFRPFRFWRHLHPRQTLNERRIIRYALLVAAIYLLPVGVQLGVHVRDVIAAAAKQRAAAELRAKNAGGEFAGPMVISGFGRSPPKRPRKVPTGFSSVKSYLDTKYPSPQTPTGVWRILVRAKIPLMVMGFIVLPVCWPWLTSLSLLVFRLSLHRAGVGHGHVLRCSVYVFDGIVWVGLFLWVATTVRIVLADFADVLLPAMWRQGVGLAVAFFMLLGMFRLWIACRSHLRLDHAAAVVCASQLMALMLALNLLVAYLVWG